MWKKKKLNDKLIDENTINFEKLSTQEKAIFNRLGRNGKPPINWEEAAEILRIKKINRIKRRWTKK